jgi:pimeloyl-ACP methyl ester carboxylesterase
VLVHGLWFPHHALIPLSRRLQGHGFRTLRHGWNTTGVPFEESAERLFDRVKGLDEPRLHFVAHSLGGLLVRALLHAHPDLPPGRVVTLGTPHTGCRTGGVASGVRVFRPLLGRAVLQLVDGVPVSWGPPPRELGSLGGTRSLGLGKIFPGMERPNDGVVSLSETRLEGATAFHAEAVSHSGMVFSPRVARLVAGFLESGAFPGD